MIHLSVVDAPCIFCDEPFTKDKAGEKWIRCSFCLKWPHICNFQTPRARPRKRVFVKNLEVRERKAQIRIETVKFWKDGGLEVKTQWDLEKEGSIERSVKRKILPLCAVVRIEDPSVERLKKVERPGGGFHFTFHPSRTDTVPQDPRSRPRIPTSSMQFSSI
jgi:hypothetical protein